MCQKLPHCYSLLWYNGGLLWIACWWCSVQVDALDFTGPGCSALGASDLVTNLVKATINWSPGNLIILIYNHLTVDFHFFVSYTHPIGCVFYPLSFPSFSWKLVAAIFCTLYFASWRRAPTWTPSVNLAVWSSFRQIPCVAAVTEAARGTHIRALRASTLSKVRTTWTLRTTKTHQSSLVSCKTGMQYECFARLMQYDLTC